MLGALFYFFNYVHGPSKGHGGRVRGIQKFVGTSAGFLIAVLLSLDYSPAEILAKVVASGILSRISDSIDPTRLFSTSTGCTPFDVVADFFAELVEKKTGTRNATLNDLLPLHFVTCAYDITQCRPVFFSSDKNGNMRIVDVASATCSVPVLFDHTILDGSVLIDGGVIHNFPLAATNPEGGDVVFGVSVSSAVSAHRPSRFSHFSNSEFHSKEEVDIGKAGRHRQPPKPDTNGSADTVVGRARNGAGVLLRVLAHLQREALEVFNIRVRRAARATRRCPPLADNPSRSCRYPLEVVEPIVLTILKPDALESFEFQRAAQDAPAYFNAGFLSACAFFKKNN